MWILGLKGLMAHYACGWLTKCLLHWEILSVCVPLRILIGLFSIMMMIIITIMIIVIMIITIIIIIIIIINSKQFVKRHFLYRSMGLYNKINKAKP